MKALELPEAHRQKYQQFQQASEQLAIAALAAKPDGAKLAIASEDLQKFFQGEVLSLSSDELDPSALPSVQSYQTEMHKQLRLLAADMMFVRASRQAATLEQRLSQVRARLQTLIGYCEILLDKENSDKEK